MKVPATHMGTAPLGDVFGHTEHVEGFQNTNLYKTWRERMRSENDFIVCIAASSRTEMSGTGKTTLAAQLARVFDCSPSGFSAEEKASLDSDHVAQNLYPDVESRSAIVFDEAQGTASSDGVDNRRSMADAVVKMSRAAATHRYKQISLIIVTQSTRWIDSRMMDLLDRLILVQEKDQDRGLARAVVFDHYFDDLDANKTEYTPAIEDLYWQPLPENDPDYQELHAMKERAGTPGSDTTEEDDNELTDEQKAELANTLRWECGWSVQDVANHRHIDMSTGWVSNQTKGRREEYIAQKSGTAP